jgi:ATP-dependent DNA helicase DinG
MDGAPGLLPEYKSLIVDEAHHLPNVAADHLATGVSLSEFHHLVKRLLYADESSEEERRGGLFSVAPVEGAGEAVMAMKKAAERFYESLGVNPRDPSRPFVMPDPPPDITDVAEPVGRVVELLDQARLSAKTDEVSLEVEGTRQECRELVRRLSFVLDQAYGDDSCYVVEADPYSVRRGFPRAGAVKAVPLDPSELLREHLVASLRSIVFTSATLSVAGDFTYFQHALGLDSDGEGPLRVCSLHLGSPFDFKKQVVLFLPRRMPHPRREETEYTRAVIDHVKASIRASHGKAFVLFTSFRMMREVAAAVRPMLEDLRITFLMQGEEGWDRTRLLNTFREDVDSVLFGVSSFWEGVDVPGESLSNLIITKLPFTVPEGPVVEARHRRLKEAGREPFAVESLPEAVLRLKQGFGRLIRSSKDHGTVAILDPRVTTERWGRVFLKALPECAVRTIEDPGEYAPKGTGSEATARIAAPAASGKATRKRKRA